MNFYIMSYERKKIPLLLVDLFSGIAPLVCL